MSPKDQDSIRLRGEDVQDGLRDWVKSELKEGPKQAYDLGKFFFSVSVGTVGAIATIEKLKATTQVGKLVMLSFGLLLLSIILSLLLALPRKYRIRGDADLHSEYSKQINRTILWSWLWFAIWLVGTAVGVWAIRT